MTYNELTFWSLVGGTAITAFILAVIFACLSRVAPATKDDVKSVSAELEKLNKSLRELRAMLRR